MLQYGLPHSREAEEKEEAKVDRIGIFLAAMTCYDLRPGAEVFWEENTPGTLSILTIVDISAEYFCS